MIILAYKLEKFPVFNEVNKLRSLIYNVCTLQLFVTCE